MNRILDELGKLEREKRACAALVLLATTTAVLSGQTFAPVYNFCAQSGCPDGDQPQTALVQGFDGNLYGTTGSGGFNGPWGTVFKITTSGALTTLYSFCAKANCTDGTNPYAGLVLATNGDFYGTTYSGGASNFGTVFRITPGGRLTTLYSFCAQSGCPDGSNPYAGLIQATNGDFYGTTYSGGAYGYGAVFRITPSGKLTTLYSFCAQSGCPDGSNPYASLVQATNGDLYGTTLYGGDGAGTVYKMTLGGTMTAPLYIFSYGANPEFPLIQATNGQLYGTTNDGGSGACPLRCGTVFEMAPKGALTTVLSFGITSGDTGAYPDGLVQATDGYLYGTDYYGGANGYGVIFKMTLGGGLTTLYDFCPPGGPSYCPGGAYTDGALVQHTNGTLYGATYGGGIAGTCTGAGAEGCGTIFSMSVGLGPFVKTLPTSGKVGADVTILGTGLSGATSVTFHGTASSFTVNATGTSISTTVPAGATTGPVQVVTPGGTLSSNVTFRVP